MLGARLDASWQLHRFDTWPCYVACSYDTRPVLQDPDLYGDGWTPLLAAAVADRCSIASLLLRSAGHDACRLACATNRYGQSSLHVAARRGRENMIELLLEAGGSALAKVSWVRVFHMVNTLAVILTLVLTTCSVVPVLFAAA